MKTNANDSLNSEIVRFDNDKVIRSGNGLTKREHFAALAFQGLLANPENFESTIEDDAKKAVLAADYLIKALNQEKK